MKLIKNIVFCTLFLLTNLQAGISQGLLFQGNNTLIDERTSYSVFEQKQPHFKNTISISFDISIHEFNSFGYIFRLKDTQTNLTYNFTYAYIDNQHSLFKFNSEGKDNLISIELNNDELGRQHWLNLSFTFYLNNHYLLLHINGKEYKVDNLNLPTQLYPHISFGKNEHVVDVPSFALRNLSIKSNNLQYTFPLNESEGNDVHDIKGNVIGHVTNPTWLINKAYYWQHRFTYQSHTVSGINFDEANNKILCFNADSITFFDVATNTTSVNKYKNAMPVDIQLGTSFINQNNGELYVYEVNNLPIGQTTIAALNTATNVWTPVSTAFLTMQLHHHVNYFDAQRNRYLVFGGFGNQRYNKQFLSFNLATNRWDTLHMAGDNITPRYFAGMASQSNNNQLFIFGGMGNESGDQTIGRRYYYDLYQVDLKNNKIKKLWDLTWTNDNIVPTRNMIMLNDSSFYALCYPEHLSNSQLKLYQFSTQTGEYKILGDSIPIRSDKIPTNANLYYSPTLKEFYCTVQIFDDNGASITHVYSLYDPPIDSNNLQLYPSSKNNITKWLWLLLLLPLASLLSLFYKNSKKRQANNNIDLDTPPLIINNKPLTKINIKQKDKANAIYLFGEFTVYDKNDRDITYMFSARLRQAFLLILQHSYNEGISSQHFSEALWPERTEQNVKNLRGVTINQLRKIIADLNGIELVYDKGHFKIIMTDDCYCDYWHFLSIIDVNNSKSNNNNDLTKILLRGKFLKSLNNNLYNTFREQVEAKILFILPVNIENAYKQNNYDQAILLCEALFATNQLNEQALYYIIHSLSKLKQQEEAKKRYAIFSAEYKNTFNQEYTTSFLSILKDEPN